ncbi:MAG: hypothetical protein ACREYF_19515 [Gammaproteobacteria bacterium]
MMAFAGGLLVITGFVLIAKYLGLVEKSLQVVALSRQALAVLQNSALSDDDKEVAMRAHAATLARLFIVVTSRAAVALLAPVGVIWLLDARDLLQLEAVLDALMSPTLILGGTIIMVLAFQVGSRKRDGR